MAKQKVKGDTDGPVGTAADIVVIGRNGKATVREPGPALVNLDELEQPTKGGKG